MHRAPQRALHKALIEIGFPSREVSQAGSHERHMRKGHVGAIKTWWARRPHSAMRALIYASAVSVQTDAERDRHLEVVKRISSGFEPGPGDLAQAIVHLRSERTTDQPLRLLDFFAGGGTIPFEAGRLGMSATALELNPVGYLVLKVVLEGPQKYGGFAADVARWGKTVLDAAQTELEPWYKSPEIEAATGLEPVVALWTRTVACPDCTAPVSLSKLNHVAKRPKRMLRLQADVDQANRTYAWRVVQCTGDLQPESERIGGATACHFCGAQITPAYLKNQGGSGKLGHVVQLVALVSPTASGKSYLPASDLPTLAYCDPNKIEGAIADLIEEMGVPWPDAKLKAWSGIVNPTVYGFLTSQSLFNPRQLLTMVCLVKQIRNGYRAMLDEGMPEERATAIVAALTSLTDHLADWNCTSTVWISQNEQCGRALAGPGIPMMWDYVELFPFSSGPANLYGKLDRMVTSLRQIPIFDHPVEVVHGSALSMPFAEGTFDLAVVDPPYYDSLFYSALSDCFRPWQGMVFQGLVPQLAGLPNHEAQEIVASRHRTGASQSPADYYQGMMTNALAEARRVLKDDGLFLMIYSHKTIEGWETIARAVRDACFIVEQAWPLEMERKARPRAMKSDALSAVVVFVMRKRVNQEVLQYGPAVIQTLQAEIQAHLQQLEAQGWRGTDLLVGKMGRVVSLFTKYVTIRDEAEQEVGLDRILRDVVERTNAAGATSDSLTRLYLAWRDQYGEAAISLAALSGLCQGLFGESSPAWLTSLECQSFLRWRGNSVTLLRYFERSVEGTENYHSLIHRVHGLLLAVVDHNHRVQQDASASTDEMTEVLVALAGSQIASQAHRSAAKEATSARKALARLSPRSRGRRAMRV